MANDILANYRADLIQDFLAISARLAGLPPSDNDPSSRPKYTVDELKDSESDVTSIIPNIKKSGNATAFSTLEAALKNANTIKAKINTKRLEAFCGDRVKKAAAARSFYFKAASSGGSIPGVIKDALGKVIA